jgi:peptide/nickel transport system substrate-binding protein
MKQLIRVSLLLAMLALVAFPAMMQDGADQGGTIFLGNAGDDPKTFNPILGGDVTSSDIYGRIYPTLLGVNVFTGAYEQGYKGSAAESWTYNEDGTVLTINLRKDLTWNDGTPITANDWVWPAMALKSGLVDSPRTSMWETLDDGTPAGGKVVDVKALDDYTIEVTFSKADCVAISDLFGYLVPSAIYEADFGDDLAAMNDDPRYLPGTSWGAWKDVELIAGDRTTMISDQQYPDTELGYVSPEAFVYLTVPNVDVQIERFRAGELTITGIPGTKQAEFAADPNFQTYRFNRRGYVFYAFNHANPANPQPAFDESGTFIEQDPHPILGDKLVRQAIVMSVDMDAIIENNLGGNAVRVGIPSIPASWDWNPDLLYPFDPARAGELLDEAGWVLEDGSEFRVCHGCMYSQIDPAYEGTEMVVTLNDSTGGDEQSVKMVEFIAQSMRDIGINATVQFLDWGSAFLPALDGQTFDMAILAWSLGLPLDPNNTDIFGSESDVPGSGFNFGSYHNEKVNELYADGRDPSKTNGCDTQARKAIYDEVNQILFDELPYMFMYANLQMAAAQKWLEGWDPATFSRTWNEDAWKALSPVK